MQCVLPVQLKQQLWICRQEVRIYITFELLKDACYLASVQQLGQSMQLCIVLSVGQVPGAFASTSPGLGCSAGSTVILHVLKEVCMLQKTCVVNKVLTVSMPKARKCLPEANKRRVIWQSQEEVSLEASASVQSTNNDASYSRICCIYISVLTFPPSLAPLLLAPVRM